MQAPLKRLSRLRASLLGAVRRTLARVGAHNEREARDVRRPQHRTRRDPQGLGAAVRCPSGRRSGRGPPYDSSFGSAEGSAVALVKPRAAESLGPSALMSGFFHIFVVSAMSSHTSRNSCSACWAFHLTQHIADAVQLLFRDGLVVDVHPRSTCTRAYVINFGLAVTSVSVICDQVLVSLSILD